ncbi:MAG: ABC transporter permease [Candidatus Omnitrophica bacterium]|nr:ABC transporter permease [Candidatus Omnitrophota bacterium]
MGKDYYEVVIQPNRSWLYVDWKGLLHYRDLLWLLVRRDFVSKYKQTILGPLWFFLQPFLTALIFALVFARGIKIPTDGLPPFLFYFCGLVPWGYFSQCLLATSQSLSANAHILGKVYFPRLVIPLSIVISNVAAMVIQLVTFLSFYFYFKFFTPASSLIQPNEFLLLLPFLFLQAAMLSLGFGLWIAALTVKYRDFQHLVGFLTQLWMYATPIIYPLSVVPERLRWLAVLNPMAVIVEGFRYGFFGVGFLDVGYWAVSFGMTCFFLVSGVLVFNRVERTFVDTI